MIYWLKKFLFNFCSKNKNRKLKYNILNKFLFKIYNTNNLIWSHTNISRIK